MKMKNIIYILLLGIAVAACGSKGDDLESIQERAGMTAQEYYRLLLDEKYDDFVSGMDGGDSIPAAYRQQMVANTAMFVKDQKDAHKGIKDITLKTCKADTASHTAEAMLTIMYADDAQEMVCVPMVERNGVWFMK